MSKIDKRCIDCVSFRDLSSFDMGLVCLKEVKDNNLQSWSRWTKDHGICEYFDDLDKYDPLEWDETKNQKNIQKHSISFNRAYEITSDPRNPKIISKATEHVDIDLFLKKNIPLNEGNLDIFRDEILGLIDGRVYLLVTTFRHSFECMKYRVISLRLASKEERDQFYFFRKDLKAEPK